MNPFALLLSSGFLISLAFGPQSDGGLKQYAKTINAETARAYETKNSQFFDHLFAKNFESTDEHGVVHKRKESLFVVRFQLNTIKFTDVKETTQSIKLEKARGTVVTSATMMGLTPARQGRPAQKVKISRRWSDVFERHDNQWELVSRTELTAPVVLATPLTPATPVKK